EPGVQSSVPLNWIRNPDLDPDTASGRRAALLQALGMAVRTRRRRGRARAHNPPLIGAGGGPGPLLATPRPASVSAAFNPGGIQRALETIEQEQRRLVQFGVSQIELDREIANSRAALETAVQAAATRSTPALANALLGAANDDKVFSSPATNLALLEATVKDLKAAQVSEAVKRAFEGQGPLALVVTPEPIEGGETGVTALLEASRATPVAAPAE